MKKIIIYLLFFLVVIASFWVYAQVGKLPQWVTPNMVAIKCILIGILGGTLYCLRGVYLSRSIRNDWSEQWATWYYLRPIVSGISGLIAYVFLKAGLIALGASQVSEAGNYGYLAFAFIAGFNVDKFLAKIEDVAKSIFGIEKSRAAKQSSTDQDAK